MYWMKRSLMATAWLMTASVAQADVLDFGVAGRYNAFIFENFTSSFSDVEGAVAVGGNMVANGYSINALNKPVDGYALVVGNHLTYGNNSGGSINNGNIYAGGTVSLTGTGLNNAAFVAGANPIDFAAERAKLTSLSQKISDVTATGTVTYNNTALELLASNNTDAQVFDIDGALFNTRNNVMFAGFSSGQTIILNISGSSLIFNGGTGTNFAGYNVLFNFYEATTVNTGSSARGSILAPLAEITGTFANINGNVIAKAWNNNTQVDVSGVFKPVNVAGLVLTPVPEPETYGMLLLGLGVIGAVVRRRQQA